MHRNSFKTPEGTYQVDLHLRLHAINGGAKPLYQKSRSQLRAIHIDLVDSQFLAPNQSPLPTTTTASTPTITKSTSQSKLASSSNNNNNNNNNNNIPPPKFNPCSVYLTVNTAYNKVFCHDLLDLLSSVTNSNNHTNHTTNTTKTTSTTNTNTTTTTTTTSATNQKKQNKNHHQEVWIDQLSCDVSPCCHKLSVQDLIQKKTLNILIGFINGSIAIHNAITKKNLIFNQKGNIDSTMVKCVQWCHSHVLTNSNTASSSNSNSSNGNSSKNSNNSSQTTENASSVKSMSAGGSFLVAHHSGNMYLYHRSYSDVTTTTGEVVQSNLASSAAANNALSSQSMTDSEYSYSRSRVPNTNPIAKFHVSNSPLNDIQVSIDGKFVAVACNNGYLKVIEIQSGKFVVCFRSYFGAFTCCSWSPDMKYIVAGSEDDLISVFDWKRKSIVARGIGHTSYVSAVVFDPVECDHEHYRVLSVGDDCKLILWDIEKMSDEEAFGFNIDQEQQKINKETRVMVPSLSMDEVPTFDPVQIHRAHDEPIRDLTVFDLGIVTVCNRGVIKFWVRPKAMEEDEESETSQEMIHKMDDNI